MRTWKQAAALTLSVLLTVSAAFPALAVEKPADMDNATWARLQDNTLEYYEIENLVLYYNPTYRQVVDTIEVQLDPLKTAVADLKDYVQEQRDDARRAKDDGDMMSYKIGMATASAIEKQAVKGLETGLRTAQGATKTTKDQIRRTMTSVIEGLVITYHQTLASKELVDTSVALAQAAYDSVIAQQGIGMATEADVQSALKSLTSAQNGQKSLNDGLTTLKRNICVMTGWDYNADMEIAAVPAPELASIDTMNPDEDTRKAISYHPTIISLRGTNGHGDVNRGIKERSLEDTENKINTKVHDLYTAVLQSKITCDGAASAYESARLTMEGNERKYAMGMLGNLQYLQLKMVYLQQKQAYDSAVLSLKQAINDYNWALYGVVTLD